MEQAKAQDLVVITNNKEQLKVDKNGTTWINELILGRNRISHGTETPGYSGAKGDLVFNTAYVPGGTFAWLCLGAFRWHELKSAIMEASWVISENYTNSAVEAKFYS